MTPEQKAAFVAARVAHFQCEMEGMRAHNEAARAMGRAPPFCEPAFKELAERYSDLYHNSLIVFFRD